MKIRATPTKGKDLQPGDLFSTAGPEYWDSFENRKSIGERVFIRTLSPRMHAPDAEEQVFKITIQKSENSLSSVSEAVHLLDDNIDHRKKLRTTLIANLRESEELFKKEDYSVRKKLRRYVTEIGDQKLVDLARRYLLKEKAA